jgi:hypothetical protein
MSLEVELAFEGVVDRLDHLPNRPEQVGSAARLLPGAGRAQERDAMPGEGALELAAVVVPVGDHRLPVRPAVSVGSASRIPSSTARSSAFAPETAKPTGRPCRVHGSAGLLLVLAG